MTKSNFPYLQFQQQVTRYYPFGGNRPTMTYPYLIVFSDLMAFGAYATSKLEMIERDFASATCGEDSPAATSVFDSFS